MFLFPHEANVLLEVELGDFTAAHRWRPQPQHPRALAADALLTNRIVSKDMHLHKPVDRMVRLPLIHGMPEREQERPNWAALGDICGRGGNVFIEAAGDVIGELRGDGIIQGV